MHLRRSLHRLFAALAFSALLAPSLQSNAAVLPKRPDHWVGTWAAAPVAAPASETAASLALGTEDITLREIVHVSIGGPSVRIVLSNEFGSAPLTIGAASIAPALPADTSSQRAIDPAAAHALTFSGKPSVIIPPGALVVSDATPMTLAPLSDLAVSLFVPAQSIPQVTQHSFADQTNYAATGNLVAAATLPEAKTCTSWLFLKGVDVFVGANHAAVVAFGDSITDGAHATLDANARWPDVLARRLQADPRTNRIAVLNEGIGGNRVLHDVYGPSALARFDRDVIAQAGVKYVILFEGINDIGHATDPVHPYDVVTADDIIAGLEQLVERAHMHGIQVIGATLTPFVGAKYQSADGEKLRLAVNTWYRTSKSLDGVIDFAAATHNPKKPTVFLPAMDSGDHLHPSDAGYKAMGETISLKHFMIEKP